MRLIDADRLKETIHTDFSEHFTLYHDTDQTALMDMVMDDIDEMPTAFYKEKVMAELYKKYNKLTDIYNVDKKYDPYCASKFIMNAYKDAIDIVEKGGKTEDFVKFRQVYEKLK